MIKPEDIPQFTGDLDALQRHITGLRRDADGIRQAGGAAHTQFQAMSAFYKAPEAEDLFASTMPVRDKADAFAEKVETVAGALDDYAQAVGPIAERLKHLKSKATTFIAGLDTDGGAFGTDWTKDQDKVDQHEALWAELAQARADFYAAEIAAANKITALVDGGTQYVADTGGNMFIPRGVTTYGFTVDALENAEKLPWGTPAERTHHAWDLGYHGKQLLWDGLVIDGIVGSLKGAAALVGLRGPGEARAAWEGLTRSLVGTSVYATEMGGSKPGGSFWNSDFVQGSKPYAKGLAKGLVAWDQWKENPGRAAGTTIFNFGTLAAGPVKAGTAGRTGAMAKAANAAAKAGEAIDPVVAAARTAGTVPRVGDIAAGMRAGARGASEVPRRTYTELEFAGGYGVRVEDGEFIVRDGSGNPSTAPVPREPAVHERTAAKEHARQYELVGAGARAPEGGVDGSESLAPHASARQDLSAGRGAAHSPHGQGHDQTGGAAGARNADGSSQNGSVDSSPGSGRPGGGAGTGAGDGAGTGPDASTGSGGDTPGRPGGAERPSFMREGDNPYGDRGSLTREQIEEIQVYRANHEPGYFNKYYKGGEHLGDRKSLELTDESGFTPPQLTRLSDDGPLIRAKDSPEPPKPHFIDADYISVRADSVTSAPRLKILNEAAQKRHFAIQWDHLVDKLKTETGKAHKAQGTLESGGLWGEAKGAYKESHTVMGDAAEEFGEAAARHHYVAERYPDFEEQTLLGPKNGNDQFDQVWKHEDGRVVVVEAKSSPGTRLGRRTLPGGKQVSQGSREYFFDIVDAMKKRGEFGRVRDLQKALKEGKLEYVVVKGEKNAGAYTGYQYRRFDISKGTLP